MWCVCPKLDCASLSFIKSFSYIKATVHNNTQQKGLGAQRSQNVLQLCPSLNYISGDGGGREKNGIEFQRTNVCLNEFPAPLMLRGGRASKRGGIDGECLFMCACHSTGACDCVAAWRQTSAKQCLNWPGAGLEGGPWIRLATPDVQTRAIGSLHVRIMDGVLNEPRGTRTRTSLWSDC